jgi:hypothetical protein
LVFVEIEHSDKLFWGVNFEMVRMKLEDIVGYKLAVKEWVVKLHMEEDFGMMVDYCNTVDCNTVVDNFLEVVDNWVKYKQMTVIVAGMCWEKLDFDTVIVFVEFLNT